MDQEQKQCAPSEFTMANSAQEAIASCVTAGYWLAIHRLVLRNRSPKKDDKIDDRIWAAIQREPGLRDALAKGLYELTSGSEESFVQAFAWMLRVAINASSGRDVRDMAALTEWRM